MQCVEISVISEELKVLEELTSIALISISIYNLR